MILMMYWCLWLLCVYGIGLARSRMLTVLIRLPHSGILTAWFSVPWKDQLLVIIVFIVYELWLMTSQRVLHSVSWGVGLHSCIAQVDFKSGCGGVLLCYEDCVNQCCWYSVCYMVILFLWLIYVLLSGIVMLFY